MNGNWMQSSNGAAAPAASGAYFQAAAPAPTPPPFNPYQQQQQGFQAGYGQPPHPMQFYSRMGYQQEPTMVEIISDLLRDSNSPMRFWTQGGLQALTSVNKESLLQTLSHFFKNVRVNVVQDDTGMFLQIAAEQGTEEGKRIQTLTDNDISAKVQEIAALAKEKVLDAADMNLKLHREASQAAAANGAMGAMMEGLIGEEATKSGGVMSAVGGAVGSGLRAVVGLPPANRGNPPPGV